jgi:predicted aspartyl protease
VLAVVKKGDFMSFTYEKFTVKHAAEAAFAAQGKFDAAKVHQMEVNFLLDTGAWSTFITEKEQVALQLPEFATQLVKVGGGRLILCKVVGPLFIEWKDQRLPTNAYIMPGQDKPILGALAMEGLDIWVHPKTGQVERAHTDEEINVMY